MNELKRQVIYLIYACAVVSAPFMLFMLTRLGINGVLFSGIVVLLFMLGPFSLLVTAWLPIWLAVFPAAGIAFAIYRIWQATYDHPNKKMQYVPALVWALVGACIVLPFMYLNAT